ncbi:MAG: UDP-N-acetylmuramoyl-L-alanine--D-glutamate ligase [Candidatus Sungbacteria bacterium]|nr:UDP-N-acetylmuramoyl-L-alanine--D-glutamate ligase [Candidatus Sungbacteria bacterium]
MLLRDLKNKNILILGYGVEGQSTMRFLKHVLSRQCTVDIADQKNGPDYLEKQKNYDLVIRSPGIPKSLVTRPSTTATNIFFANTKGITVGITGSKGKSTTASLLHAFLHAGGLPVRLVGNIGNPMLDALIERNTPEDIFVCELSSYQLDDIEYSPHISLILNFFPEHMDYHGGVRNYWDAKKRITAKAAGKDYFVYNPEYSKLTELARRTKARAVPFIAEMPFPEEDIPLIGVHNRGNIRAAATVALLFNISYSAMSDALKKFKPLPHRLESVGIFNGIAFYDDAISTTPESAIAAIRSLPNIGTIFLGGKDRGYDFSALAREIITAHIENIVLFPESGVKIKEALEKTKEKIPNILETLSMKEAVHFAYERTNQGAVCLLSSASPSYSLWKNFEEKGNDFQNCVRMFSQK